MQQNLRFSLYDGLDLLDAFELNDRLLLQKRLKDLVCRRRLGVQLNLGFSVYDRLDILDAFEVSDRSLLQKHLKDLVCRRGLGVQQNLRCFHHPPITHKIGIKRARSSSKSNKKFIRSIIYYTIRLELKR